MGIFDFLRRKESLTRISMMINQVRVPQSTPVNYAALAKQGYQKNITVFRCVNLIANACAGIEWEMRSKGNGEEELENHPVLNLLNRPNPLQGRAQFFQSLVSYFAISGNSYINAFGPNPNKLPTELWTIEPQYMQIVPGKNGYPAAYQFNSTNGVVMFPVDFVNMKSSILHLKTFHPTDLHYGMSPLEAALLQIDTQNSSSKWNLALLQNSATPSGVLTVEATDLNPSGKLTTEQFNRLKEQIEDRYVGSTNAGRPMLLEGGLKWQQTAIAPKDMEYIKGKELTSREVANAFGVPPLLLNIAGDNTYANYKEARLAFYEETVLPLMDFLKTELNRWLVEPFDNRNQLDYDKDDIEALAIKREAKFNSLKDANFLTQNEKREAAGYDEKPGWDVFVVNNQIYSADEAPSDNEVPPPADPSSPEGEDEVPQDDQSTELAGLGIHAFEVKLFNLLNQKEKQTTARSYNKIRAAMVKAFSSEVSDDLKDLESELISMGKKVDPKTLEYALLKVIDDHAPELKKTIKKNLRRVMRATWSVVNQSGKKHIPQFEQKASRKAEFKFSQFVERYIEERSAKSIQDISGTTRKSVIKLTRELLAKYESDHNFDLPGELQKKMPGLVSWRADNIARTEVNSATNEGSIEAVKTLEIPGMQKEWVSTIDEQSRDNSSVANHVFMNGTRIGLDEKFTVPPDTDMNGPGDPTAPPEQICNCRCLLVFSAGAI